MRTALASTIATLVLTAPLFGQNSEKVKPKWGPAPPVFPKGAQMAVMAGDPSKAAPFTVQLSFPDGYQVPPHFHPTDERVVVKRGILLVGMGDSVNLANTKAMTVGKAGDIAANMHHYAVAKGGTLIAVSAMGPFALTYVHEEDDPQRAAPTP